MDSKVLSNLLNPVRMQIFQLFLTHETETVKRIAEELPEIPPASLYRHINKMVEDEILEICAEYKIRGTVEKVYRLKKNPLVEVNEQMGDLDKEELFSIFYTYTMALLGDFDNYLKTEDYDFQKDRVGFRSFSLYLSDEEYDEFYAVLKKQISQLQKNQYSEERKLRKLSFVATPGHEK